MKKKTGKLNSIMLFLMYAFGVNFIQGCATYMLWEHGSHAVKSGAELKVDKIYFAPKKTFSDRDLQIAAHYQSNDAKSNGQTPIAEFIRQHPDGYFVINFDSVNSLINGSIPLDINNINVEIIQTHPVDREQTLSVSLKITYVLTKAKIQLISKDNAINIARDLSSVNHETAAMTNHSYNYRRLNVYANQIQSEWKKQTGSNEIPYDKSKTVVWIDNRNELSDVIAPGKRYKGFILSLKKNMLWDKNGFSNIKVEFNGQKDPAGRSQGILNSTELSTLSAWQIIHGDLNSIFVKNYNQSVFNQIAGDYCHLTIAAEEWKIRYRHPIAARIIMSPLTVALDVVTSPFQLIALSMMGKQ